MNMSAVSPAVGIAIAVVGAGALVALEWRRRDERHRAARIAASVAAVTALALLGVYRVMADERRTDAPTQAVLWTQNSPEAAAAKGASEAHFALRESFAKPPSGATVVPDVAYIRRRFPEIRKLRIVGEGLEPFELDALAGLELVFEKATREHRTPTITFLNAPRELTVGESLRMQGRIDGVVQGERVTLALVRPDGEKSEIAIVGNGAEQTFEIIGAGPQAEGQFVWRFTAQRADAAENVIDEAIGVSVARPLVPRVLLLESSPRLDTAHLQRWFAEIGGTLVARTTVGQGRYRFASTSDAAAEFGAIERELLARFDIVLADAEALAALAPAERDALDAAVREEALGLLVRINGAEPISPAIAAFLPWPLERDETGEADAASRTARLDWRGLGAPIEHPVAMAAVRVRLNAGEHALVTDTQQRPVVAAARHGRGQLAVAIARDTWKWRLQDQSAVFAGYWSYVFGELAKPRDTHAPRWVIENPPSAPLTVDQPIDLRLAGAAQISNLAQVTANADESTALPLAEDPAEPNLWRTTFWPRKPGWHRVQLRPEGTPRDFYVHDRGAWASLASARRAAATMTAAATQTPPAALTAAEAGTKSPRVTIAGLYALFLVSAGYLWWERRRAAA